jgi:hypothetical protein
MSRNAWRKPTRASLATLLILSAGCAPVAYNACPTIVPYSAADQNQMADELVAPPPKPMIERALRDYAGLRDQVRACQKR